MIRYNDDNIYVGYIKQLLHTFNLPCCKIDNPSNKYYVGEYFINSHKNAIYRVVSVDGNGRFLEAKKVCDYKFGDEVLNITKHLELRNNYYDTYTHEYLGDYLRFIRDYKGIDLMSLYNCFSNNMPTTLDVDDFNSDDALSSIYMIKVKPHTTYTIAIECHSKIEICCGHYAYNDFLDENITNKKSFNGMRFNTPITYTTTDDDNLKLEKAFKMFIKVPSNLDTSIVVLEGDYTKSCETQLQDYSKSIALDFLEYIANFVPFIPAGKEEWYLGHINTHVDSSYVFRSLSYVTKLGGGEWDRTKHSNIQYQEVKNKLYNIYTLVFDKYESGVVTDTIEWESPEVYLKDILSGNYLYLTKNQLLAISSSEKYLLADRLVEYLSRNAITPDDEVINNIKKVQLMLAGNKEDRLYFDAYGFWSEDIRKWIYRYLNTHQDKQVKLINVYNDLLSYVDKDVETMLGRLTLTNRAKERLVELGGDEHGI